MGSQHLASITGELISDLDHASMKKEKVVSVTNCANDTTEQDCNEATQ